MGVLREGSEKVRVRTTLIYTRMIKGCAAHPCSLAMLVRERASLRQEPRNGKPSTPFLSSPEKKKKKSNNSINAHTIKIKLAHTVSKTHQALVHSNAGVCRCVECHDQGGMQSIYENQRR